MIQTTTQQVKKGQQQLTQQIWKYTFIVLLGVLFYCIPGFLSFSQLATDKGYHFFRLQSSIWALVGFVLFGSCKYAYFAVISEKMDKVLNPKLEGQQRMYKLRLANKLSFDCIFYTLSSLWIFVLFHKEPWFPSIMGGEGSCDMIFRDYPDWPKGNLTREIEIFYMLKLGIHGFSLFESLIIKRTTDRKYYEFLLHHFIANTLILFSLLINTVAVGTIILFLHNISDATAVYIRFFGETRFKNMLVGGFLFLLALFTWFYMRVVVFPCCVIQEIYNNLPGPMDIWGSIRLQYSFLGILCSVLVVMHIYWWLFLLKAGVLLAMGKGKHNTHDPIPQKKE